MCNLNHFLGQGPPFWKSWTSLNSNTFEVSEIWGDMNRPGTLRTVHRSILNANLSAWLEETRHVQTSNQPIKCVLRVVWGFFTYKGYSYNVATEVHASLAKAFGLEGAQAHEAAPFSWSACTRSEDSRVRSFYFGRRVSINLTWSREEGFATTNAICVVSQPKSRILKEMLDERFVHGIMPHEMVLWFLCAGFLCKDTDIMQGSLKDQVKAIELRTGYHEWLSRDAGVARGDLSSLSAKMSGLQTLNAMTVRDLEATVELIEFIKQQIGTYGNDKERDMPSHQEMCSCLNILSQRAKMHHIEAVYLKQRIESQLAAVS